MSEVIIKFENEDLEGLVAVGTYLIDAMARFGIVPNERCDHLLKRHNCSVIVREGVFLLSEITPTEEEHFARLGRKTNERLACEARIERPGEIVIMTDQTTRETEKVDAEGEFHKEFESLPLEQKFAKLFKMEALVLSETISYVLDSPYKVFEKIGDVMAGFGRKMEEEAKKAKRPSETKTSDPVSPSSRQNDSSGESELHHQGDAT